MRKTARTVIKEHLCKQISETRVKNKWTKKKMAEKLAMDDRSYSDIEKGVYACSMVTLVMYVSFVLDDSEEKDDLFAILRKKIEEAWLEEDES
jgi:DNA-binding XRE family transcriptional regulator